MYYVYIFIFMFSHQLFPYIKNRTGCDSVLKKGRCRVQVVQNSTGYKTRIKILMLPSDIQ